MTVDSSRAAAQLDRMLQQSLRPGCSPVESAAAAVPALTGIYAGLDDATAARVLLDAAVRAAELPLPATHTLGGWYAARLTAHVRAAFRSGGRPVVLRLPWARPAPALAVAAAAVLTAACWQRLGLWTPPTGEDEATGPAYAWAPPPGRGHARSTLPDHAVVAAPDGLALDAVTTADDAPHLHDPAGRCRIWLVPRSRGHRGWAWERLRPYLSVVDGLALTYPHADQIAGPGPSWITPDGWSGRWVADPARLISALTTATRVLGPPAELCIVCGGAAPEHQRRPAGGGQHAHLRCIRSDGPPHPGPRTA
ncbi:hypothetical protein [Streptomyces sp. NRRL S-1868]|uniref:hypothetical protein n=1 Tax=Streptomyces sp. NRRL S-1868 TaxID=1463892 RepID=UPI00131CA1EA|nr:hypothetical protein [Streptomyces sp. NRRL S-1868]